MPEMRSVLLTSKHTHEGVTYYPGQEVTLPKEVADALVGLQVEAQVSVRTPVVTDGEVAE